MIRIKYFLLLFGLLNTSVYAATADNYIVNRTSGGSIVTKINNAGTLTQVGLIANDGSTTIGPATPGVITHTANAATLRVTSGLTTSTADVAEQIYNTNSATGSSATLLVRSNVNGSAPGGIFTSLNNITPTLNIGGFGGTSLIQFVTGSTTVQGGYTSTGSWAFGANATPGATGSFVYGVGVTVNGDRNGQGYIAGDSIAFEVSGSDSSNSAAPYALFTTNHGNNARANTIVQMHSGETNGGATILKITAQGTAASPTWTPFRVFANGTWEFGGSNGGAAKPAMKAFDLTTSGSAITYDIVQGNLISSASSAFNVSCTVNIGTQSVTAVATWLLNASCRNSSGVVLCTQSATLLSPNPGSISAPTAVTTNPSGTIGKFQITNNQASSSATALCQASSRADGITWF